MHFLILVYSLILFLLFLSIPLRFPLALPHNIQKQKGAPPLLSLGLLTCYPSIAIQIYTHPQMHGAWNGAHCRSVVSAFLSSYGDVCVSLRCCGSHSSLPSLLFFFDDSAKK